ncbi:replication factor RFC1 C terminal domain-containing protein [Mortierella sp. GBAus27b]|nr:replication factor RFC1 C terminal domain-containing protein [Mortierella sp. GBAus27b]
MDLRNYFVAKPKPRPGTAAEEEKKPKAEPEKKKPSTRKKIVIQESDEEEEPAVEVKSKYFPAPTAPAPAKKQPAEQLVDPKEFFGSSKAKKSSSSGSASTTPAADVKSAKASTTSQAKSPPVSPAKPSAASQTKATPKDESGKGARAKESGQHSTPAKRAKGKEQDDFFEDDSDAEVIPQPKLRTAPATKTKSPELKPTASHKKAAAATSTKTSNSKKRRGDDDDEDAYNDEDEEVAKPTKKHKPAKKEKSVVDDDAMDVDEVKEEKPKAKFNYWAYKNKAGPSALGSKEVPVGKNNCLAGWTFVFTGELSSITREDASDLVKRYSGRVTGSPSGKTSYVVIGEDAGQSKLDKVKKLKLKTLSEDEFLDLIRTSPEKNEDGTVVKSSSKTNSGGATKNVKAEPMEISEAPSKPSSKSSSGSSVNTTSTQGTSKPTLESLDSGVPIQADLWTTKYRPVEIKDICGNKAPVERLTKWLSSWHDNYKLDFKPENKNKGSKEKDDSGKFRAALISGPPGIGKTTAAHLVGKSLGFNIVEFNASDTRSKKSLDAEVRDLLDNQSLAGYFQGTCPAEGKGKAAASEIDPSMSKKQLIIMDEVDGMSGGDRGGVAQLILFIKKTHVPIICICNDRQSPKVRSLTNYCFDLRFQRPQPNLVRSRLMSILYKEGRTIPGNVLDKVVSGAQSDIRQVLNILSAWSLTRTTMDYDEGTALSKASEKYVALNPFQIAEQLLVETNYRGLSLPDKFDLYFNDYQLSPLMIQENYIRMNPTTARGDPSGLEAIELMSKAADSLSDSDLVDTMIHGAQHWSLMQVHAAFSCVRPSFFVHGSMRPGSGSGYGPMMQFPGYLGQYSKSSKYNRLMKDLQIRMRLKISGDKNEVRQSYLPVLFSSLSQPLIDNGTSAIPDLIKFMDGYYLTREDWDTVLELGIGRNDGERALGQIPTATKAAFTKTYNINEHPQPFLKATTVTKARGGGGGGGGGEEVPDNLDVVEADEAVPEEVDEKTEQEEEQSIDKDKNIKQMPRGKARSAGGSATKSKAKGKTKASK